MAFIEKNNISCYYLTDTDYPVRLRECPDAPILFYFKGNTNLDATRIISIVGTRNATEYGRELTESLIKDLAKVIPDLLVVRNAGIGRSVDRFSQRYRTRPSKFPPEEPDCRRNLGLYDRG